MLKLDLYRSDVMALAKSFLIKSELVASETEYSLSGRPDTSENGRRSWKYYLNISGQYHETDVLMRTRSLDTLQIINFTKDVINQHPITKANLLQFGQRFKQLVDAYPNQIALIYGILYQPDLDDVIASPELTILDYNRTLVEPQEYDLIYEVQKRIWAVGSTIASKDWNDIERSYSICYMMQVAKDVPYAIKATRYSKRLTGQAHSYFIWNHINRFVKLEDLKELFDTREVMFLYKNIDRLAASSGGRQVLNEILDRFITSRGIRAYSMEIQRDTNELAAGRPQKLEFVNAGLNVESSLPLSEDGIYNAHVARSQTKLTDYRQRVHNKMLNSLDTASSREITLVDSNAIVPLPRMTLTAVDLSFRLEPYNTQFYTVINHIDNKPYSLSYRECCVLYIRLVQLRTGAVTETIPLYSTHSVPKLTPPTADLLVNEYRIPRTIAEEMIQSYPTIPTSPNDKIAQRAFKTYFEYWEVWFGRQLVELTTLESSAYISRVTQEFMEIYSVDFTGREVNFDAWLLERGIALNELDVVDLRIIENVILENVFNLDIRESTSSTVNQLSSLLDRFTAYHVNVTPAVEGSMNLPNSVIGVLYGPITTPNQQANVLLLPTEMEPATVSVAGNVNSVNVYTTQGTAAAEAPLEIPSPYICADYEPAEIDPRSIYIMNT